jgi:predicted MFS family arabinose efflux permease
MHPPREASAAFVVPLVVLTLGHMLSNAVRTLPAIAADVLGQDLAVSAEELAGLTGAFHIAFAAGQVPLGVALDRFGIRPVALALLATVILGAAVAALAGGPGGFLLAQIVMGLGCSGMLITPMTLAAKLLTPARFGLWTGLIQALGNTGMLLSASPLALLVEAAGWRAGYWAGAGFGLVALLLVLAVVRDPPSPPVPRRGLLADAREVLRHGASPALRAPMVLAFCSFAAVIGLRGLWGGPWLMGEKGLDRIEAGHVLMGCTLALTIGPALAGMLDRRTGHPRALLIGGHLLAALALGLVALGGSGGLSLPASWDLFWLVVFGLAISSQALIFALTRAVVPPAQAGKALSAVNFSFFLGAAVLQAASGPVASWGGVAAALAFFSVVLVLCTWLFWRLRPPSP